MLRHSSLSMYYEAGMQEKIMQKWAGWNSDSMVDVYVSLSEKDVLNAKRRISGEETEETKPQELKKRICRNCGYNESVIADACRLCGTPLRMEKVYDLQKEKTEQRQLLTELRELRPLHNEIKKFQELPGFGKMLKEGTTNQN